MTEKEQQEREAIKLEIRARKEVLKKLENPFKRLRQQADANYEKSKTRIQAVREYGSIEEAHDAWGYDCITEEEYEETKRVFELGDEYVEKHISPQEAAVKILGQFISGLYTEIHSFEFDLLPNNRQVDILQKQEQKDHLIRYRNDGV